ncbi:hypothetical protein [Bradyrhizobium sp. TM239]|uniref:hypothetical protein n=1 Tax=Bradyrhizobium sp. TM239 TaxID=2599802 RepID=UPI0030C74C82
MTERLLGDDRDDGQQAEPGNQEKQPHREFHTPAHIFAMIAKSGTERKGRAGLWAVSGGVIHGWLRWPMGGRREECRVFPDRRSRTRVMPGHDGSSSVSSPHERSDMQDHAKRRPECRSAHPGCGAVRYFPRKFERIFSANQTAKIAPNARAKYRAVHKSALLAFVMVSSLASEMDCREG